MIAMGNLRNQKSSYDFEVREEVVVVVDGVAK
jgi:hypothetical protein